MATGSEYERCVATLEDAVDADRGAQVMDASRSDDGGYFDDDMGIAAASAGQTPAMATRFGLAALIPESRYAAEEDLLERFERAIAFQRDAQRDSGCIDLPISNIDSPPDTAFGVSILARLGRYAHASDAPAASRVCEALDPYLRSASEGIARGGFHTPNHRWVIVGGLAQVQELYEDLDYSDRITAYLDEGIDCNVDGVYTERSHGIYSHVVNEHLIDAARVLDRPPLLDPVRRNLDTLLDFMNADWTIDTTLSRRQDHGTRPVPVRGAPNFYYMARVDGDERYAAAARGLLEHGGWTDPDVVVTMLDHFLHHREWRASELSGGNRSDAVSRQLQATGAWRFREGRFAGTVARDVTEVVSVSYGGVDLDLLVRSPYFGMGDFEGTAIEFGEETATVSMERPFSHPDKPCYWEPLGRPVEWGSLDRDARTVDPMPPFGVTVTADRTDDWLAVHVETTGGVEEVPFLIEARFPAGGWLEFTDGAVPSTAEEPVFLGQQSVTYRRDSDALTVGPGRVAHRIAHAPDAPSDRCRVVVTDWSPVDRTLFIAGHRWRGTIPLERRRGGEGE